MISTKKSRTERAIMSMLLDPMRLDKVSEAMAKSDASPLQDIVDRAAVQFKAEHSCFTLLGIDSATVIASHGDDSPRAPMSLLNTYCFYTGGGEPFRVAEAKSHPLVCDLEATKGVGSYLGVPVTFGGFVLGALCVWNALPRDWTGSELAQLTALAAELTEWWQT